MLIVNVDDVGNSHAANAAVIDAMENGLATSSTIIVPGPWFPEIASYANHTPIRFWGSYRPHQRMENSEVGTGSKTRTRFPA
jgi:hypothetical protein